MSDGGPRTSARLPLTQRRDLLLAAAREEFVRNGLAGATTRTIAAAAGTTEAVMYRLFPSKDALFDEAVCDPLEQLVLRIAGTASQLTTTDTAGRAVLDPDTQERLLHDMIEAIPLLGAAVLNQQDGAAFYTQRMAPLIDLAVKAVAAMLRSFPRARIDPEVLFLAIFGMHMGIAIEATKTDIDLDIPATAAGVVDILTHGLGSSA